MLCLNLHTDVIDSISHLLLASPALEEDFVVLSNFIQTLIAMRIGEALKGRRASAPVSGQKIRLLHIRTLLLDMLLQYAYYALLLLLMCMPH